MYTSGAAAAGETEKWAAVASPTRWRVQPYLGLDGSVVHWLLDHVKVAVRVARNWLVEPLYRIFTLHECLQHASAPLRGRTRGHGGRPALALRLGSSCSVGRRCRRRGAAVRGKPRLDKHTFKRGELRPGCDVALIRAGGRERHGVLNHEAHVGCEACGRQIALRREVAADLAVIARVCRGKKG